MADPTPVSGIGAISRQARQTMDRVSEVERPTGTSYDQTVAKVFALFDQLDDQVAAAIATNSYTKAQIEDKLAQRAPISHSHDQADVSGTWTKAVNTTGDVAAANVTGTNVTGGNVYAQSVSTNITATRVAVWARTSDGFLGTAASSERYKTAIRVAELDPEAIISMEPVFYEYIAEREMYDRQVSGQVPYAYLPDRREPATEIGMIAERLHEAGLWPFVVYKRNRDDSPVLDENGQPVPDSILYPLWCVAQQVAIRHMWGKLQEIETRLATAGIA